MVCVELDRFAAKADIFAQRMPDPVFGEKDAAEVRVTAEGDAKEIVNFALEEVCGRPDPRDGRHSRRILRHEHAQPQALGRGGSAAR